MEAAECVVNLKGSQFGGSINQHIEQLKAVETKIGHDKIQN